MTTLPNFRATLYLLLPPGLPPGRGGGGGGGATPCTTAPGCDCAVQFPDTTRGAAAESKPFTFSNPTSNPITIQSVKVQTDHPELWQVDTSQLGGTLQPGETRNFMVTFTPPAK